MAQIEVDLMEDSDAVLTVLVKGIEKFLLVRRDDGFAISFDDNRWILLRSQSPIHAQIMEFKEGQ